MKNSFRVIKTYKSYRCPFVKSNALSLTKQNSSIRLSATYLWRGGYPTASITFPTNVLSSYSRQLSLQSTSDLQAAVLELDLEMLIG
jgi:hypothetical protein